MATTAREKLVLLVIVVSVSVAIVWTSSRLYKRIAHTTSQIQVVNSQIRDENHSQVQVTNPGSRAPVANQQIRVATDVKLTCGHKLFNISEWVPPALPSGLQNVDQKNPDLVRNLCDNWIIPPFPGPRQLANPNKVHYSQRGQSQYIDNLLKKKRNGFYIECGAAGGEGLSNSLFFEKDRDWSGLLIEANPISFKSVLHTRRHAYMVNACLSPQTTPTFLDFTLAGFIGGLTDLIESGHKRRIQHEFNNQQKHMNLQCFPLVSILRALNVSHVDYFSLDIEGGEMGILNVFPFDEIQVDVLTVEYTVSSDAAATRKKLADIKKLLVDKFGYHITSYEGSEDVMLAKGV